MEETQKIFEPPPIEREDTLVHAPDEPLATPRFDEVEEQVARPVVPLAGSSNPVKRGRRQWPIALVLISALAGGAVSLFAFRLYQQRQGQAQVVAAETERQKPEAKAAPTPQAAATEEVEQAQSQAPVVFEEFDPAKESAGVSDAKPSRKAAETDAKPARSIKDERKDEAKPAAPEPRARLVETITARREEAQRDDRRDDDSSFEQRRERRRERRERRREPKRNIDRIKDIFEGAPPA